MIAFRNGFLMHPITFPVYFLHLFLISIAILVGDCWNIPPPTAQLPKVDLKPAIPASVGVSANESAGHVLETHHTTCQITTEELVATAQATATRVLTGLCNSREMEDRFKALEQQISDLLRVLKAALADLEGKILSQNDVQRSHPSRVHLQSRADGYVSSCVGNRCPLEGDGTHHELVPNIDKERSSGSEVDSPSSLLETHGPREEEIARLNNTVHMEPYPDVPIKNPATQLFKVFTYYWRVHGIVTKINSWDPRRSQRSPSFYITTGGYRMYLLAFPRQNYENFYVHVGITAGANDANLRWPFPLKHRIQLIDQVKAAESNSSKKSRHPFHSRPVTPVDLSSRLWNPALLCSASVWRRPIAGDSTECVGLGFPHNVLKSRNYIYEDSIVVKLNVYLG